MFCVVPLLHIGEAQSGLATLLPQVPNIVQPPADPQLVTAPVHGCVGEGVHLTLHLLVVDLACGQCQTPGTHLPCGERTTSRGQLSCDGEAPCAEDWGYYATPCRKDWLLGETSTSAPGKDARCVP